LGKETEMAIWESIVEFLIAELLPWAISLLKAWLEKNFIPLVSTEGWAEISGLFQKLYDEAGTKELPKAQWAVTEIFAKILPITIVVPEVVDPEVVSGAFFKDLAEKAVEDHKSGSTPIPYLPKSVEWVDEEPDWRDDGGG